MTDEGNKHFNHEKKNSNVYHFVKIFVEIFEG